jgi:hypothetical protein
MGGLLEFQCERNKPRVKHLAIPTELDLEPVRFAKPRRLAEMQCQRLVGLASLDDKQGRYHSGIRIQQGQGKVGVGREGTYLDTDPETRQIRVGSDLNALKCRRVQLDNYGRGCQRCLENLDRILQIGHARASPFV